MRARAWYPWTVKARMPAQRLLPLLALAALVAPRAGAAGEDAYMVLVRTGGSPVTVDSVLRDASKHVPRAWHATLRLTRDALGAMPPAPAEDARRARDEVRKSPTVTGCLPVLTNGQGDRRGVFGYAGYVVATDGRLRDVAVAVEPHDGAEATIACAAEAIRALRVSLPAVGGRGWTHLLGTGPERVAPDAFRAHVPAEIAEAFTAPRLLEPRCISSNVRAREPFAVTVKFAVGSNGGVGRFESQTPDALPDVLASIERAVRGCAWIPGANEDGRPVSVWVLLPIRSE
jgi:hypothetical protein